MTLYTLYRARHGLGWLPAAVAAALAAWVLHEMPLTLTPHYDESSVQLALAPSVVEPVAPAPAAAPLPEIPPEPTPPVPSAVAAEAPLPLVPEAPPAPPKTRPTPPPKPKPHVESAPVAQPRPQPTARPAPAAPARVAEAAAPRPTPVAAPVRPTVDVGALEGGYLRGVRGDLERFKQYPTGRQASLERPRGQVVVWLLVDRSGKILDRGLEQRASSMLLNRAATTSLARIERVAPFPAEAFGGRSQLRITATFDYAPL